MEILIGFLDFTETIRSKLSVTVYLFLAFYGSTTLQSWLFLKNIKNFLQLKCDWWCSYFDTIDGYLRFIPTNGQMTAPIFPVIIWSTKVGTHQKTLLIIFIFQNMRYGDTREHQIVLEAAQNIKHNTHRQNNQQDEPCHPTHNFHFSFFVKCE